MKYISIASAQDWFYVIHKKETIVWRVAMWALQQGGEEVIGLVANPIIEDEINPMIRGAKKFLTTPPLPGTYKHRMDLTAEELACI
ncbi:MAG: hypothetical protein ABIW82_16770 [Dokdonella sp.]